MQNLATPPIESGNPLDDPRAFRRTLGQFATGVTVITTSTAERMYGMTANSFSAVSLDPALVLWSIRKESSSLDAFVDSGHFSINVLSNEQLTHSEVFGRPREHQFDEVAWSKSLHGDPLLDDAIAHLECATHEVVDAGDHYIIIGRVERYTRFEGAPLLFSQGQFGVAASFPEMTEKEIGEIKPSDNVSGDENQEEPLFLTMVKLANQQMSNLFQDYRHRVGVTAATGRVLNRLSHRPESVESLAHAASLGEVAVEDALIELAGQNLVHFRHDDLWALTDQGREVQIAMRAGAADFEQKQLKGIAPEDLEAAKRVLRTLMKRERNDM